MEKKQIAYYYNTVIKEDETVVDIDGDIRVPVKGEVLLRPDGKRWKVEAVNATHDRGGALPVYRIYLVPA